MDVLEPGFQADLLQAVVRDHGFLTRLRRELAPKLFVDPIHRKVLKASLEHFDKFGAPPSKKMMPRVLGGANMSEAEIRSSMQDLFETEFTDVSYIEEQFRDFVKKSKYRDTLVRSMELLRRGKFDEIYADIRKLAFESDVASEMGQFLFDNAEEVIRSVDNPHGNIPTGFRSLDEKIFGGAARGTQGVWLTPPNSGKTTTLINVGKHSFLTGHKVAHLTTELSSLVTSRRYYMSMFRMSKLDIKKRKRTTYDKMMSLVDEIARENLIIQRFPTYTHGVNEVRRWIETIRNVQGFIPDVLIIDMALYLKPSKAYEDKRFELSNVYSELRDLAVDYNLAQWTAHQTNRAAIGEEVITVRHLAEDFGIAGITDYIISLNQTKDERAAGTGRFFTAKVRDDSSGDVIPFAVDWTKAWMGDLVA